MSKQINARTATAADFEAAAQKHANEFWIGLVVTIATYHFFNWYAVIPGVYTFWLMTSSIGATIQASNLRKGKYKIPNPNNGAPDGDATNLIKSNDIEA